MIRIQRLLQIFPLIILFQINLFAQDTSLKIGVIGLSHTHVHWIFNSDQNFDAFEIVGIVENDLELAKRYAEQYSFPMHKIFNSMDELFETTKPEAVAAFGTIYDHLMIVEKCAPLGIHVMVEKPLAVSLDHAERMKSLAEKHNILLLTNYETTWYPSNHHVYDLMKNTKPVGDIRKVIVRDGHKGPKKIGVDDEFLEWLIDPELNGGGAITDFGCYGANLMTWLFNGQKPVSVTTLCMQLQPENNPMVDDEAIILLNYGSAVGIIQASWNWPIGRKDMEIHGLTGTIYSDNRNTVRIQKATGYDTYNEDKSEIEERDSPYNDPFIYFAAMINGKISGDKFDLSSLENNMIVMEILDAAIKSAKMEKTIYLKTEE